MSLAIKSVGIKPLSDHYPSEEDLLKSLRDYYEKYGKSPTTKYTCEGGYSYQSYLKILKCAGWSDVLRKAGLPIYIETRKAFPVDKDEIVSYAKTLIEKETITSMNGLLKHKKFYGYASIRKTFGSERIFATLVGIKYIEYGLPFECIKEQILSVTQELGRTPSCKELIKKGFSELQLRKKFGGYNEILRRIGLEPVCESEVCNLSSPELIELYKKTSISNGYENGVCLCNIKKLTGIGSDVFENRFGSINNLRRICGYEVSQSRQIWDEDNVIAFLRGLTMRLGRVIISADIKSSEDGPSITSIRRHLKQPFHLVALEIHEEMIKEKAAQ